MTSPHALTQVDYYRQNRFNPGGMDISNQASWDSHVEKRINLYQRHLAIPLSLLRGQAVLEIGPNSGENALVLAALGADLTLVEPNEQVRQNLRPSFGKFGLEDRIVDVLRDDLQSLSPATKYDLVIAEGFLNTLPNRDAMLTKVADFLKPGGLAVISFTDRAGSLLEMTRRMVLWRACQLAGVIDMHGEESLALAKRLYQGDWERLNASRPFDVWWKDNLVSPLYTSAYQWSYPELLDVVGNAGCEFYSSSPGWAGPDHYSWYKNVPDPVERRARLLDQWASAFPYFLTGSPIYGRDAQPAPSSVIKAADDLLDRLSQYTQPEVMEQSPALVELLAYPPDLDQYLGASEHGILPKFNASLKRLYQAAAQGTLDELISEYHAGGIGHLWGTGYHYICFSKSIQVNLPWNSDSSN